MLLCDAAIDARMRANQGTVFDLRLARCRGITAWITHTTSRAGEARPSVALRNTSVWAIDVGV